MLAAFPPDLSASAQQQLERARRRGAHGRARPATIKIGRGRVVGGRTASMWAAGVERRAPITCPKRLAGVELDLRRPGGAAGLSVPGHQAFALGDIVADRRQRRRGAGTSRRGTTDGPARRLDRAGTSRRSSRPPERAAFLSTRARWPRSADRRAVAQVGGRRLAGYPAWVAWLAVHLPVPGLGFATVLSVLMRWIYLLHIIAAARVIITGVSGGGRLARFWAGRKIRRLPGAGSLRLWNFRRGADPEM